MSTPPVKHHFPHVIDGEALSLPELCRRTGLNRYDVAKVIAADPTISTVVALRDAVVAFKSRPAKLSHRPRRASLLWNGCDRHRNRVK